MGIHTLKAADFCGGYSLRNGIIHDCATTIGPPLGLRLGSIRRVFGHSPLAVGDGHDLIRVWIGGIASKSVEDICAFL